MRATWWTVGGVGLGAGLMYLADPRSGRRRRAVAQDKAFHAMHEAENAAGEEQCEGEDARPEKHSRALSVPYGRAASANLQWRVSPPRRASHPALCPKNPPPRPPTRTS